MVRLGTTSYIIPDDIIPNLRHLAGKVEDVELVLFESDEFSNLPSPHDVGTIRAIGSDAPMTFTVHLPLDTRLGSTDETERKVSVEKCLRVIDLMSPITPFAWILHLHGDRRGPSPSENIARWMLQNEKSLSDLASRLESPHKLCVETLDYDFSMVADLVRHFDFSICLDVGHLLLYRRNLEQQLASWVDRTRVVHIHGVNAEERDHVALSYYPVNLLDTLLICLLRPGEPERVVTMEIFGEEDFEISQSIMKERLNQWRTFYSSPAAHVAEKAPMR